MTESIGNKEKPSAVVLAVCFFKAYLSWRASRLAFR